MVGPGRELDSSTAMRSLAPQLEIQANDFHLELGAGASAVLADSNQLLHVFLHLAGQIGTRSKQEQTPVLYIQPGTRATSLPSISRPMYPLRQPRINPCSKFRMREYNGQTLSLAPVRES